MHLFDDHTERLARAIVGYALDRIREDPPLDGPVPPRELAAGAGPAITEAGLGGEEALRIWADVLAPATISVDHPRHWAFVPVAPTDAATLFDLVVSASSLYGSTWLEGAGAVHAENEALRWLADLAGFPAESGGVFVSGGSAGNLSALVTARHTADVSRRGGRPRRWAVVATYDTHSSIHAAARVMDVDVLTVPGDERGRLTGGALAATFSALDPGTAEGVFAVAATAGTTNAGMVDDLAGIAATCRDRRLWFHVDGAYGGAALAAPSARGLFAGVEHADSLVVDPHKWLFAPLDCAALLYREPGLARAAHTQEAAYLDSVNVRGEWNPADYAFHLSRRARGLPFWFSLATHGTAAYAEAVESSLTLARATAGEIGTRPELELCLDPVLSVVVFRRRGWDAEDYASWAARLLAERVAFCVPTTWSGAAAMRFCFVNPRTTVDDVRLVLDTMR